MTAYIRHCVVLMCLCGLVPLSAQAPLHRTFATPEDAVHALIGAAKSGDVEALLGIFGPDGRDLFASAEPATARQNRQVFTVAAAEQWHLEASATNKQTLVIGNEQWPFPVPIVKDANGWRFDTAAGKEEVIARRIGRNELAVIESCRAYVSAQRRYAEQAHDGNPAGLYATKFRSDPGKEDGLYWPTSKGQKPSPLGDLVAEAATEGRIVATSGSQPSPFHGYYFRILTAPRATMPALLAWPAQYNVTGVMSFIVGPDGTVHEKDLGATTGSAATAMTRYSPDGSWRIVP